MDQMAAIRLTFFQECEDQLAALESGLLAMQEGDTSADIVNAVFRAVHSVKGGAGAFKLADLVAFAHAFESALDKVRAGALAADSEVMKLFLRSADMLSDLVRMSRDGDPITASSYSAIEAELAALVSDGPGAEDGSDDYSDIDFSPTVISIDIPAVDVPTHHEYKVRFRPFKSLFTKANEPIALIREVARLGEATVVCDISRLPDLSEFDPAESYLAWDIVCRTEQSIDALREIFDFVDGDCELSIEEVFPNAPPIADVNLTPALEPASSAPPLEESIEAEEKVIETQPVPTVSESSAKDSTAVGDAASSSKAAASQQTIRVDLDRVDRLINLVGELVINQAMLSQRFLGSGLARDAHVATSLDELEHLTRDIQESVMAIRAQPVKGLFQRMSRVVREVSSKTGKEVRLKTEGEATEVDKTVVELLTDPLTHMIRNAVDHGLERAEERLAKGKPAEGIVKLSAAHRSGRVIIEVTDDGAGINRKKVLEKAIAKNLVPEGSQLSDSEIDNLLFLPGFSTASAVSDLSGRGVGMDVVKRAIQALGGRIAISSQPDQGSTFMMSLPLTLAVLDGIIVAIEEQAFVIPLTAIVETLQLDSHIGHDMGDNAYVIRIRDKFMPLIDVGVELGIRNASAFPRKGVAIMVEGEDGNRIALLVDSIQDQRQVVIKSLETNYDRVHGIAAATILGDGRVAMILDIDGLGRMSQGDRALFEQPMAKAS